MISMPGVLLQWFILSLAFWLTAKIVPGFKVSGLWDAIIVAAVFGIANWFLGTLLYWFIGLATLGVGLLLSFFTHWFVNAVLLKLTNAITSRLQIESFGTALVAALVMSVLGKVGIYAAEHLLIHHTRPGSVYL